MTKESPTPHFKKFRGRYFFALGSLIFAVGVAATVFVAQKTDSLFRASLVDRAQTIAAGVNEDALKELSGTPADSSTHQYGDIKSALTSIRSVNKDSRFVYLMGFREGRLFFYADSEPPESRDYSAPGDFYADASAFKVTHARAGESFTESPYTDIWGTWISGYAPVFDHGTKTVLAIAGIDIGATFWREEVLYAAALPATITLFLLLLLALYYHLQKRERDFIDTLEIGSSRMRSLYEITTHGDMPLPEQFRAALALGSKTLGTALAVLSRIEREQFTVEYAVGLKEGDVFPLAETYCDITVKKGDVLSINEMKTDENHAHVCYEKFKLESYIGVPVNVFGKLHGTLAFLAPDPHRPAFTESDRDFVRLMGRWMSAMLERAQIDQMKSEFVSVASHQLRTPLTGIKWISELMQKGKAGGLTTQQKEFLDDIHGSNERMLRLVENLLNVSRIETGSKFEIVKASGDVVDIINSLAVDLVGLAHQHQVEIEKSTLPAKYVLPIDAEKMRQVFQNLLSNAVKYSKAGGTVIVTLAEKPETKTVLLTIKDTGLGIPEKQQSRMFEKFFRADNVQTAETDGTGLGLYIAKAIVEGHGGKIWFESEENKGTTFFVELPVN